MPELEQSDIIIIHRKPIIVYFKNVNTFIKHEFIVFLQKEEEARSAGLWTEELQSCKNELGEINSDFGLRGDSKKLFLNVRQPKIYIIHIYLKIFSGSEKRVKLVSSSDEDEINN